MIAANCIGFRHDGETSSELLTANSLTNCASRCRTICQNETLAIFVLVNANRIFIVIAYRPVMVIQLACTTGVAGIAAKPHHSDIAVCRR
jgi:hypothetical protein